MLLQFLGCMILAAIIEVVFLWGILKVLNWYFFEQANSIFMLYECIYPMLEDDFNNDKSLKVSIKFKHGRCKIKFRNAAEAGLRFEILVHRTLKIYQATEFILNMVNQDLSETDMIECKKDLDKICCEVRTLVNKSQEKV